ncbi:DEAD box ATP-dependent RNA helicase, putative [Perkinsus marinus ATCC 50983]|uniref:DEAD box ATP-dependent RNA helicase, putative n=1 Tax=Perkinsus marinus (strain ATCC 50983 / TXsc) TaxID=423536 RepID=C5LKZ2_PERM5|nr:DEAD box ATP-dependent RNA helicase, putative [Perkinsus marinus ATCC 50983]EER02556.1 DEAD box ATP-dependent RNA helicase, putative [Perkinsus marinus ATCC 50983]|eukprot:XP_002769838.1 DEAD box ATP-dependent RNA helicase, putative [Perkinsus marinus ATCC 50983]
MSAFEEFGLHPSIICAVEDLDWTLPTPVQAEAVPLILGGGDVCICAETGTGKTAAFGLASLQEIYEQRKYQECYTLTLLYSIGTNNTFM